MAAGSGQSPCGINPASGCRDRDLPVAGSVPRRPWRSSGPWSRPQYTRIMNGISLIRRYGISSEFSGRCPPVHRDCHRTVELVSPGAQCHSSSRSGGRRRTSSSRNRRRCCPDRGSAFQTWDTRPYPGGQRRGARNAPSPASRDGLSISARLFKSHVRQHLPLRRGSGGPGRIGPRDLP